MIQHSHTLFRAALAVFLCSTAAHAQDRKMPQLEAQARQIDRAVPRYKHVARDLSGRSTEGGTLTLYSQKSSPRKIVARYFGESGRATEEFYFRNNRLFLMRRRDSKYDKPFGKIVSTEQTQFYFANGKLLGAPNAQRQHEILQDASDLLLMAKKK